MDHLLSRDETLLRSKLCAVYSCGRCNHLVVDWFVRHEVMRSIYFIGSVAVSDKGTRKGVFVCAYFA